MLVEMLLNIFMKFPTAAYKRVAYKKTTCNLQSHDVGHPFQVWLCDLDKFFIGKGYGLKWYKLWIVPIYTFFLLIWNVWWCWHFHSIPH